MAITFTIPEDVDRRLRGQGLDPNAIAREAALVGLYRQGILSQFELSQALGLSRCEIDALLKQHGVTEDLLTTEEHLAQLAGLRGLLSR